MGDGPIFPARCYETRSVGRMTGLRTRKSMPTSPPVVSSVGTDRFGIPRETDMFSCVKMFQPEWLLRVGIAYAAGAMVVIAGVI